MIIRIQIKTIISVNYFFIKQVKFFSNKVLLIKFLIVYFLIHKLNFILKYQEFNFF